MTYSSLGYTSTGMPTLAAVGTRLALQVEEPGFAWRRMEPRWTLLEHLAGGTLIMQQAGVRWLPQEPGEDDAAYKIRLNGSVCPPYVTRLEQMLAGMICRKPVRLDDVPDQVTEQLFDVDLQGNDLNVWLHDAAVQCLRYGHIGVLVDFPRGEDTNDVGDRPYWVTYTPRDILGWRTEVRDGMQKLTQLRLMERVVVADPDSEFGEELVEQVRVLEPGQFRLYRKQLSKGGDFLLVDEGTTTLNEIPFAVAYANRVGLLESVPPLEEVGWLNLQAYRRGSDLANQLHIAAVPRQFLFGVPAEVESLDVGPQFATALPVDARVEFIEPQGTSYQYQFQHLSEIERQINQLGVAAVLGQKAAAESGLSKSIERSQGDAALMTVALQLQDLIDNCLRHHAAFLNLPQAGSCSINRDFVSTKMDPAQVAQVIAGYNSAQPLYTQETALRMLADGEVLPEDFDIAAELDATAALSAGRLQAAEDRLAASLPQPQEVPDEEEV